MHFTSINLKSETFGPQSPNDTIRFQEMMDYVNTNYFSKSKNIELYAQQAIDLAKKLNNQESLAELYRMMGVIQYFNGKYDVALHHYMMAVKLYQSQKNIAGEASTYNEIGNVYRKHKRPEEALKFLSKAYHLSDMIHDTSGMAKSLNLSGIVYEEKNELSTALENYRKALSLYMLIQDSVGQSYSYENIGGIYLMKNDFNQAEIYLIKSLKIREDKHLEQATAMSYHYLGELYQKKGNIPKSNTMFDAALSIGMTINYPDVIQMAYFSLAKNYKQMHNFPQAYAYFEKATLLKDSLFNVEKSKQLTEMQTKYEVDNQIQENKLLKQSNELSRQQVKNKNLIIIIVVFISFAFALIGLVVYKRRQQNLAIQTQIKIQKAEQQQRIRISHDLHDHVGAQLSYVVSNLDIAGQEIMKQQLDPRRLHAITEMSKQAISTLRETVWALNNESISIESFADKFKAYAQKMSDLSEGIQIEFHEDIEVDTILLPNTALHLFRICQEAFSNALKHAACTKISIDIRSNSEYLMVFKLSDNGIGFDPESAKLKGHFGLENMKHRASEVLASYDIKTQMGKGTQIELMLKKNTTYASLLHQA